MSPSETVRAMLEERGIKWWEGDDERKTLWESNGLTWEYFNDDNGDAWLGFLGACEQDITPEQAINATVGPKITEDTSDGWHSFKDLYHHRALLFSVIVHDHRDMCWKSKRHDDGTELDWNFIVGIDTPWGQASYHYGMEYWDMFDCKVLERAPKYDGYTPEQSVERIAKLVELDAATVGEEYETHICKRCGVAYELSIIDKGFGKPRFCPNCGARRSTND